MVPPRHAGLGILLALLVIASESAGAATPLEGRWRLVEQRYEAGAANVMAADRSLHVEFARDGAVLSGTIWAGDDPATAVPWPAFVSDAGPLPLTVRERSEDTLGGAVRVRYLVHPSPGDDLVLDVVESYRVSSDHSALEGSMEVKFVGGDRNRGGFTLHRRFERER